MDLTKEYFDEQIHRLVTREQAANFATKADLHQFANKDDLLELATKNDLASVRSDIAEVKALVRRIDQRTDEDHRAALRDLTDLKHRVSTLERSAGRQ